MGNARSLCWIVVALALTVLAHVFLSYKGGVERALVQRTSLLGSVDGVERVSVTRGDSVETVIARKGRWRLVSPYAAIVDERTVMKLLDTLRTAEIEDTYSDEDLLKLGRTRADFGLSPARFAVSVTAGETTSEFLFGSATPNGSGVYAAVVGENAVFVLPAASISAVDLKTEDFRRRELFPVASESVNSFDVKRGSGSFMRFVRDGDAWRMVQPEESPASGERVGKLLAGVLGATAAGFVWPTGAEGESATATAALLAGYGLDPEGAVTLTFKCADGHDRQVSFGKVAREGLVYALAQNATAIVTVDAALKDAALAGAAEFTDTRIFPVEPSSLTRVSVSDGELACLLAKGADGAWRLDAPVSAATDAANVERLLARLTALRNEDLDERGVTVSISTNRPPVAVARDAAWGDLRPADLRSLEILRIDRAQLKRIVVQSGNSTPVAVVYDRDRRAWNVESSEDAGVVSAAAVEAIAASLDPLVARQVVRLKVSSADLRRFGLETPRLTLAIDQANDGAVRRNVLVGDVAEGGWYATLGATDAVFVLPDETVRRFETKLISNE